MSRVIVPLASKEFASKYTSSSYVGILAPLEPPEIVLQ